MSLRVSPFLSVIEGRGPNGAAVLVNDATGAHFAIDALTIRFLELVRQLGSPQKAAAGCGIVAEAEASLTRQLIENGVLISDDPNADVQAQPKKRGPFENQLIFFRFDVLDLLPTLRLIYPLLRLLFTPVALAIWIALLAIAGLTVAANMDAAIASMRDALSLSASTALTLGACFMALKVVHEFGHAAAYRFFCGREALATGPIRAGICFFALAPFPFTNVTGAWRLRSRWRRAAIGAAGIYFETWAAAIALIAWASLEPGELRTAAFQLALISGISTLLFNLNPLVRLDGYFIFTDIAGLTNLGTRAAISNRALTSWAFGAPWRSLEWGHLLYGVASYAYRWVIFAGVFWLAFSIDPRLAMPVAIIALSLLVLRPLITSLRTAIAAGVTFRGAVTSILIVGAGVAAVLIPAPDWIVEDGRVERFEERPIYTTTTVLIEEVAEGGTPPIALRLSDPTLVTDEINAAVSLQRIDIAIRAASTSLPEVAAELREERKALDARITRLVQRRADLVVTSNPNAIWRPLAAKTLDGAWVASGGAALGIFAEPQEPKAVIEVDQGDRAGLVVEQGTEIRLVAWHDSDCAFTAPVSEFAATATRGVFELTLDLEPTIDCVASLPHGAALRARLDRPDSPVASQLWRSVLKLAQARLPIALNQ